MRILYFSLDYTTHDRRFLAKMATSRHEIVFLRLHDDGIAYETRELPANVRVVRWEGIEGSVTPEECLRAMPRFAKVLADIAPDLVHAGPIPTCAFMVALARFRPLMAMSWGSDILVDAKNDALTGWTTRFALAHADSFVVDCDAVRGEIHALIGATPDRFVQFPWGLELARFPRHNYLARAANEIKVLSTRSWAPIYGIETVLESFALAHREEPQLRLVLVGDGPLKDEVSRAIDRLGIETFVRRTGRIPEEKLGELFAEADIYLSCARSDGTSVSLLEAMSYGLPIVVTDAPGNREWVANGEGGWLAPADDAYAFADALLQAARVDSDRRLAIALHNRGVVERRADWDANIDRLLIAYDRFDAARSSGAK